MRIHTTLDYLSFSGLIGPGQDFGGRPLPVTWHKLDTFKSRTAAYGYSVTLEGSGGRNNTGMYGAGDYCGATWDEWGTFFGRLYARDPGAICGSPSRPTYSCAEDYHWQTGHRFVSGQIPADTHARHRWEYAGRSVTGSYTMRSCAKCSAVQRWLTRGTWSEFLAVTA